jgi:signal transduction histidine kinase
LSGFLRFLRARRIGTQIALLVATSLLISQVIAAATFLLLNPRGDFARSRTNVDKLVVSARLLAAANGPAMRDALVEAVNRSFPELVLTNNAPAVDRDHLDHWLTRALQREVGAQFTVFALGPDESAPERPFRIGIRLPDGTAIATALQAPGMPPLLISSLVFLATVVTLLSLWAARALAAPLKAFADAAERFTLGRSDAPLSEQGPVEIRTAARALNEMRARIRRMVEDRTRMLATVSHDLRTPIMRLRLRAEEIEVEHLRREIVRDLDTMRDMIHSALCFLRDQPGAERLVRTDLSSLLQTVCDGFCDMGKNVVFAGPGHVEMWCDPDRLTRALTNLIDNGVKFASSITVELRTSPEGAVVIEVKDDGPGIPDREKERVLEPFYRGDASLAPGESTGFGLGLSIALSVVEQHGGTLELRDATPRGLVARLTFPAQRPGTDASPSPQC